MNLPNWIIPIKKIILSDYTDEWCILPYPNHLKGCPNFNKKRGCPPNVSRFHIHFDIEKTLYIVHSEFDLESHANRMKNAHPNWSDRQAKCVLYWQPKSRKQMRERTHYAMQLLSCRKRSECPEAMGLNVYATALKSGLILDKIRKLKTCRHITVIGN